MPLIFHAKKSRKVEKTEKVSSREAHGGWPLRLGNARPGRSEPSRRSPLPSTVSTIASTPLK